MRIGILALQGAFAEHEHILKELNIECVEIRKKADLDIEIDGLILPGGESTVIGKLLHELDLYNTIKSKIENGLPVFSNCAGLILLAKNISNDTKRHLATLPVTVKRNAYGKQLGSFCVSSYIKHIGNFPMVFIRAPYIESVENDVEILATVEQKIVAVQYKNQLATAFHPELTNNYDFHKYFIELCHNAKSK